MLKSRGIQVEKPAKSDWFTSEFVVALIDSIGTSNLFQLFKYRTEEEEGSSGDNYNQENAVMMSSYGDEYCSDCCPKRRIIIEWRPISKKKSILCFIFVSVILMLSKTQFSLVKFYDELDQTFALEELMHAPPSKVIIPKNASNTMTNPTNNKTGTNDIDNNKGSTKIIGFADFGYMRIAHRWYRELEKLGYNEHWIIAQDTTAADYFESMGDVRYDLVYKNNNTVSNSLKEECEHEYTKLSNNAQRTQRYRRSLFGSRWHYVLKQLKLGYHILLTDVDNIYTQYKPMSEMENSQYDVYHAYAGTVPSFPLNLFRLMGLTLCGGMSWLRSTPSVIDFASDIVRQCHCVQLDCDCYCDDQVVVNKYIYYNYIWDHLKPGDFPKIPSTLEEMSWEGYSGYNNKTGHRVKIWDRDVAYRAEFDEKTCPNKTRNWIAMPTGLDREKSWDIWNEKCLGIISRTN